MLKAAGAMLLILCGWAAGRQKAAELRRAVADAQRMIRFLKGLSGHLQFDLPALQEMLARSGEALALQCLERMQGGAAFPQAYRAALAAEPMAPRLKEILEPLGQLLGAYDAASQTRSLEFMLTQLEEYRGEAKSTQQRLAPLYQSAGVLAGVLICILLV